LNPPVGLFGRSAAARILPEAEKDAAQGEAVKHTRDAVRKIFREERVVLQREAENAGNGQQHHTGSQKAVELFIAIAESHSFYSSMIEDNAH
jgi:hypothetical protein